MKNGVWLGAELNRRHVDFQSTALPTELPSRGEREHTRSLEAASLCKITLREQARDCGFRISETGLRKEQDEPNERAKRGFTQRLRIA